MLKTAPVNCNHLRSCSDFLLTANGLSFRKRQRFTMTNQRDSAPCSRRPSPPHWTAAAPTSKGRSPDSRPIVDWLTPYDLAKIGLHLAIRETLHSLLPLMTSNYGDDQTSPHELAREATLASPAIISSRSNSARPPSTVSISRPWAVAVSARAPCRLLKPAPRTHPRKLRR